VTNADSATAALPPLRDRRSAIELAAGFAVLVVMAVLLAFAVIGADRKTDAGYQLGAVFAHIDGLDVGSDVRLAGITVGHVTSETVDPKSFKARVLFSVRPDIHLSSDTAAIITSDSLLGGKYIALSPGGETQLLKPGSMVTETQGSISLEQLLSKFIFSVTDTLTQTNRAKAGNAGSGGAAPGDAGELR
jgi:phospholipid/cholesterol/gamma-HCH transport system substrate-binding protein